MTKAKETVFSDDEIYDIYHRLSEYTKVGALAKNKHIDYVNRIKHKKERLFPLLNLYYSFFIVEVALIIPLYILGFICCFSSSCLFSL